MVDTPQASTIHVVFRCDFSKSCPESSHTTTFDQIMRPHTSNSCWLRLSEVILLVTQFERITHFNHHFGHTGCLKNSYYHNAARAQKSNQNWVLWSQILPWTWLGSAWSCLTLERNDQKYSCDNSSKSEWDYCYVQGEGEGDDWKHRSISEIRD